MMRRLRPLALLGLVALAACAEFRHTPATVSRDLVTASSEVVVRMRNDRDLAVLNRLLGDARGVVVLPNVVKAGFIGAAEGGNGVLLARAPDGGWSAPAFYTLAAGSVGFQLGVQSVAMILVLRNDKAVQAVVRHQGKLGADAGATIGFIGGGAEAATTTALGADIVAFAQSNIGVFGGISLEGSALVRRNDLNEGYYGAGATPEAILFARSLDNPHAEGLKVTLAAR